MLPPFGRPAAAFAVALRVGRAEAQGVAAFESGDPLLAKCDQSADFCLGFIEATVDAMNAARSSGGTVGGWSACIPAGTASDQVRDIAMTYLRNHPETAPCKRAQPHCECSRQRLPVPAGATRHVALSN